MRWVHEDCLASWLRIRARNQGADPGDGPGGPGAQRCELCRHPFAFSNLYAEGSPQTLPFSVLLAGVGSRVLRGIEGLAWHLATAFGFAVLPFATAIVWGITTARMDFLAGEVEVPAPAQEQPLDDHQAAMEAMNA